MDNIMLTVRIPEIQFHIQSAIRQYQGELDTNVDLAVEKAIRSFDYRAYVGREIDDQLRAAIKKVITNALGQMLYSTEFNAEVEKALKASLVKS